MTERDTVFAETGRAFVQQHSGRPAPSLRHGSGKRDNDEDRQL